MTILSVCIPTYNRDYLLSECLSILIPQVKFLSDVEVLIVDNCSTDKTAEIIKNYQASHDQLRNIRLNNNTGYAGSQNTCIMEAKGKYIAILCDDDIFLDGHIKRILTKIKNKNFSFLAQNYYNFYNNYKFPNCEYFAPKHDVIFQRGYDIMNYPSVGHISGFIFNRSLAKVELQSMLSKGLANFEKHRGIVGILAIRLTAKSSLPTMFIGERGLAVRIPDTIDYDLLGHLCLDYIETWFDAKKEGLINNDDYSYRLDLVEKYLWKAIFKDSRNYTTSQIISFEKRLSNYFAEDNRQIRFEKLLLILGRFCMMRTLFFLIYKFLQRVRRRVNINM